MCSSDIFVAISYALGSGLIVFGIPSGIMFGITLYIVKRIEKGA